MVLGNRFDDRTLRRVQLLITGILKEFDRLCRELDIPYSVYGGTAIGAIRHKGFIPWDDDVDVFMRRPDYERFLKEAPALMDERFRLDSTRTDPEFPYMFAKLVLKDTLLIPEFAKGASYRMPFFIDVLPLDYIPDDHGVFKAMSRRSWFWGRLLFLYGTPKPYVLGMSGVRLKLVHSLTSVIHYGLRVARISPRKIQAHWDKAVRRYENAPTGRLADFTMRDPQRWIMSEEEILSPIDVPFEHITVKISSKYDDMLQRQYGDYMVLPPVEQRWNHDAQIIDFGPYEEQWND
ncbi:LicD family protein [Schaalia cardiffensis]|uniref:LicD family protein n=1 Tax=Schaalia cardiffensis TaxID=181487 RepID=UPI0023EF70DF|nr:LicD family protein [Schaalia cardiffensis]